MRFSSTKCDRPHFFENGNNDRIFEIEKGIKNNKQVVDRIVQLMIDNAIEDRKELTFYIYGRITKQIE